MAFTQAQYDQLIKQVASGAQSIQYDNGKSVTYIDLDKALKLLALMEKKLGIGEAATKNTRVIETRYSR